MMGSPFEAAIRDQLNRIVPGVYDDPARIETVPEANAQDAIGLLVEHACKSQSSGNITIGRRTLTRLPKAVLMQHLPVCIERHVNIDDEWEYRRLLELLTDLTSPLLSEYVRMGLKSALPDIREAAMDFAPESS